MTYYMSYDLERGSETYNLVVGFEALRTEPGVVEDVWAWQDAPPWARYRYPLNQIPFALTQHEEDDIREAAVADLEVNGYD